MPFSRVGSIVYNLAVFLDSLDILTRAHAEQLQCSLRIVQQHRRLVKTVPVLHRPWFLGKWRD